MKQFKIRCSAIGKIMTDPKTMADRAAGVLSKTAQSYCDQWIKEQIYNRQHEFYSKYTEKGNFVEAESIEVIAERLGFPFLIKNTEQFENEYFTGEPDVLPPNSNLVIDAKNSWDWSTFPLLEEALPNSDYRWQMQGYMSLTERSQAMICYVLSDTPEHLINMAAWSYVRSLGADEMDIDIYDSFAKKMTYPDIPARLKFKSFEVARDEDAILRIEQRVLQCRAYIDNKMKQIKQ